MYQTGMTVSVADPGFAGSLRFGFRDKTVKVQLQGHGQMTYAGNGTLRAKALSSQ